MTEEVADLRKRNAPLDQARGVLMPQIVQCRLISHPPGLLEVLGGSSASLLKTRPQISSKALIALIIT
jgi:hypothetical protein